MVSVRQALGPASPGHAEHAGAADANHPSHRLAGGALRAHERRPARGPAAAPKPQLKKLRLALVVLGLSALAVVSTVFGMLMAVASDLPSLENRAQYRAAENSVLYADSWGCKARERPRAQIAKLTGNQNRILVRGAEISPNVKNAVIAIEDRRFYGHEGSTTPASRARSCRTSSSAAPPRAAPRSRSSS